MDDSFEGGGQLWSGGAYATSACIIFISGHQACACSVFCGMIIVYILSDIAFMYWTVSALAFGLFGAIGTVAVSLIFNMREDVGDGINGF